ncbi:fasciclin domain-containing protein [Tamlana sp. 2201CG12-4]|uniref:fasciclin domain-containing protein n=1 Tax=Tamlana sp. 2201CG12-4 TaxID=3112582 RepID=UPI002DB71038|nr:fasciclin domain-containing protein [Tamlana sp. 2201CG12-4]MEC3907208.1 fasciclin domain-containing protein [Tamlana sp. 2201CG12-4]
MKKKLFFLRLLVLLTLAGCEDDTHDRYSKPDWLEGDIASILENRGNYTIFLEGLKKVGYLKQVSGRANLTVFAPSDDAFTAYFNKKQVSGLDDIPEDVLKSIITYHLVQNTYTKERLIDLFEEPIVRLPTFLRYDAEEVLDVRDNRTKRLFKNNKWVPLFHKQRFDLANVSNPATNFNYFFENAYMDDAIYYGNAMVEDYEIPAENGYLYTINEVVEPLDNIYDILKRNSDKHDYFLSMLDEFKYFRYDEDITRKYGGIDQDSLFTSYYTFDVFRKNLSNEEDLTTNYEGNHRYNINAFVPYDTSLKLWLENNVLNADYPTLDNIPLITKKYILNYFITEYDFSFPERIEGRKVLNDYNIPIVFPTGLAVGECASNGVYYGINETPDILLFNTVLKIPFTEANYRVYLYILENSGTLPQYLNESLEYTTFIPHNDSWENIGLSIDFGDPDIVGDEEFLMEENGQERPLNRSRLSSLVGYHTITGEVVFSDDIQVISNQNKFGVTFAKGNQVWSGGNEEIGGTPQLVGDPIETINGKSYRTDNPIMAPTKDLAFHIALHDRFKAFNDLIVSVDGYKKSNTAGNDIIGLKFLKSGKYTAFIPSNAAIAEAQANGEIPLPDGDQNTQLKEWLSYFFVNSAKDQRTNYFLPKESINEWLESATIDDAEAETYHLLKVISGISEYKVVGANNEEAIVNIEAASLGKNGLLYEIDNVISFK